MAALPGHALPCTVTFFSASFVRHPLGDSKQEAFLEFAGLPGVCILSVFERS